MYAIKQAMLLSGALPLAEITVFYMDIRAFGKNYEQFFQNARAMGIQFIKARPLVVGEGEGGGIVLRYEDQEGGSRAVQSEYDLVVLSLAMVPAWSPEGVLPVSQDQDGFVRQSIPKISPAVTEQKGMFVAGCACGPKDIVDTIVEGGSAAMEVSNYLSAQGSV
jgi:heterodisulfide reductase subunit A